MKRPWKIAFLLILSLTAFALFLNGPDIVTSHEARVALPARAMAEAGWPWNAKSALVPPVTLRPGVVRLAPDWDAPPIAVNPWLVPVMSGQIRLQKPPLPYWCAAVCFRLFGGFSETAVRLIPALLGALAVLFVYDLGRVLYGRRVGWLAGLVWVSTYALPDEYRKAMADPYLAFFTLGCVWSWIRACLGRRGEGETRGRGDLEMREYPSADAPMISGDSVPASPRLRGSASNFPPASAFLIGFYVSFAMALLAKGPPAFVDILLPVVLFQVLSRRRIPGALLVHAVGIALMLLIALPWPVYVWKNVPHAIELWRYESVGELTDNVENARPAWFYLPQLLFLTLPWTAVWGLGIARQIVRARQALDAWMRRRLLAADRARGFPISTTSEAGHLIAPWKLFRAQGRHFFPILWFALMVVFFSFVHLKKNQYLLPMLPAQALLVAQGFEVMMAGVHRRRFTGASGALVMLQTIIGVVFAGAVVVLVFISGHTHAMSIFLALLGAGIALVPLVIILVPAPLYSGERVRVRGDAATGATFENGPSPQPSPLRTGEREPEAPVPVGSASADAVGAFTVPASVRERGNLSVARASRPCFFNHRRDARATTAWPMAQALAYTVLIVVFWKTFLTPREDERSAKLVAAELLALSREPGHSILTTRLPEEVAVYLPLDVHYDFRSNHVLMIIDDQHGVHVREQLKPAGEIPAPGLNGAVPDARVIGVRRVPLKTAPGDARWKVYELTVERKGFARMGNRGIGVGG